MFYKINEGVFYCPVDLTLHIVGGRWKSLVLWNLRNGAKRYSELKKILVVINDKMLSQVLRELERDGVLEKNVSSDVPVKIIYSISEEGKKLLPILEMMSAYGSKYVVT